ncbi:MAG: GTP-binding protein [Promethearchaeota archaeon]|nr:MAG: GTP-binding protein [Candidatus Lokiarchaeota archaeon]
MEKYYLFKICIIGDGGVGKTTILHQYVDGKFVADTMMTIGTNFFIKEIELEKLGTFVRLQIWDLGGQDHFAAVRPSFYSGAKGIIYVFDLTRRITFSNLLNWKREISRSVPENIPSILIGNKSDLLENQNNNIMTSEDISEMKDKLHFSSYFETSAKENTGIHKAFIKLAEMLYLTYKD